MPSLTPCCVVRTRDRRAGRAAHSRPRRRRSLRPRSGAARAPAAAPRGAAGPARRPGVDLLQAGEAAAGIHLVERAHVQADADHRRGARPAETVSISTPPSLRPRAGASISQRSLGHFRPRRGAAPAGPADRARRPVPRPPPATGPTSPRGDRQRARRSARRRRRAPAAAHAAAPAGLVLGHQQAGLASAARRPKAALSTLRCTSTSALSGSGRTSTRARSSSAVLVDAQRSTTSTLRPGSRSRSCSHSASAPH